MKKIRKLFQSSLVRTISIGLVIITIPVMAVSALSGYTNLVNMRGEVDESYSSSTRLISQQLLDKLLDLERTATYLFVDDDVVRLAAMDEDSVDLWYFSRFQERLSRTFQSRYINANVTLIFPMQQRVVSTQYGVEHFSSYPATGDWALLGERQSIWAVQPSIQYPQKKCFSMMLGYVSPRQSRPLIIIEISEAELQSQLKSLFQGNRNVLAAFMIDHWGESIAFDEGGIVDAPMVSLIQENTATTQTAPLVYQGTHGNYRLIYSQESSQYTFGLAFDEGEILRPVRQMVYWLIGIMAFAMAMGVLYILLTYRRIYTPATQLASAMHAVGEGDFSVRAPGVNRTDFGIMAGRFNRMVEQIDRLLRDRYLSEVKLKKAQLRFLQSQINPHFLYNTLFVLYNMIKSRDLDNAAEMVIYLARFYQLSAHTDSKEIPVAQELENIRLYLNIHQLRMPGKLAYEFHVEEGLESWALPMLSLQTLVENSITHAFVDAPAGQKNEISISISQADGRIVLCQEDNGAGLTAGALQDLQQRIHTELTEDETHGLQNVYVRFRLLYGDAVEMKVDRVEPHGTRVTITIPSKDWPQEVTTHV